MVSDLGFESIYLPERWLFEMFYSSLKVYYKYITKENYNFKRTMIMEFTLAFLIYCVQIKRVMLYMSLKTY